MNILGWEIVGIVILVVANVAVARNRAPALWVKWGIVAFCGTGIAALLCWMVVMVMTYPAAARGLALALLVAGGAALVVFGPLLLRRMPRGYSSATARYASYTRRVQP